MAKYWGNILGIWSNWSQSLIISKIIFWLFKPSFRVLFSATSPRYGCLVFSYNSPVCLDWAIFTSSLQQIDLPKWSKKIWWLYWRFLIMSLLRKKCLANFGGKLGNFLFHHLVTLHNTSHCRWTYETLSKTWINLNYRLRGNQQCFAHHLFDLFLNVLSIDKQIIQFKVHFHIFKQKVILQY